MRSRSVLYLGLFYLLSDTSKRYEDDATPSELCFPPFQPQEQLWSFTTSFLSHDVRLCRHYLQAVASLTATCRQHCVYSKTKTHGCFLCNLTARHEADYSATNSYFHQTKQTVKCKHLGCVLCKKMFPCWFGKPRECRVNFGGTHQVLERLYKTS